MCFPISTDAKKIARASKAKRGYKLIDKNPITGTMRSRTYNGTYRFGQHTNRDRGPTSSDHGTYRSALHGIYVWLTRKEARAHNCNKLWSIIEVQLSPKDFLFTNGAGTSTYRRVKPIKFVR